MSLKRTVQKAIQVYVHWQGMATPMLMDMLYATPVRGKEIFLLNTLRHGLLRHILLGVYDGHRMGALRFRLSDRGSFLEDQAHLAAPPWAKLRDLEYASLQLKSDHAEDQSGYMTWLTMLIAPGGSLGGARPKASVLDESGHPWIAKFSSRRDEMNIGKWEYVAYQLAVASGVEMGFERVVNRDLSVAG